MVEARTRAGDAVREMVSEVETEVARLIAYVNDEVIPGARQNSSRGLRAAAEQLTRMAAHLDRAGAHAPEQAGSDRPSTGQ